MKKRVKVAKVAPERGMRAAVAMLTNGDRKARAKALAAVEQARDALKLGAEAMRRLAECERVMRKAEMLPSQDAQTIAKLLAYAIEGDWV